VGCSQSATALERERRRGVGKYQPTSIPPVAEELTHEPTAPRNAVKKKKNRKYEKGREGEQERGRDGRGERDKPGLIFSPALLNLSTSSCGAPHAHMKSSIFDTKRSRGPCIAHVTFFMSDDVMICSSVPGCSWVTLGKLSCQICQNFRLRLFS
jgi:hypothetical protein